MQEHTVLLFPSGVRLAVSITPAVLTPVVAKCSAGAVEYMRIARVTNISQTIEKLKKEGLWVYGASMEGKRYSHVDMTGPAALVIGAEGEGLSHLVKQIVTAWYLCRKAAILNR